MAVSANDYRIVYYNDSEYPEKLKNYAGMPKSLYLKGNLPDPERKSVAIVGARSCSIYGRRTAEGFAKAFARAGVQVISGLALGIDACAHKGSLDGGGLTFAVMGCGIDQVYPRSNAQLYRQILQTGGGVISEFEPGAIPAPYHFPLRNRIISALSDAVIIVEARIKSGSLITASYALEQGVSVYAVPGKISDRLSAGTNNLIWQGATPAVSADQILEDLGSFKKAAKKKNDESLPNDLSEGEKKLVDAVSDMPMSVDDLCTALKKPASELSPALLSLELSGIIYSPFPGSYVRAHR